MTSVLRAPSGSHARSAKAICEWSGHMGRAFGIGGMGRESEWSGAAVHDSLVETLAANGKRVEAWRRYAL